MVGPLYGSIRHLKGSCVPVCKSPRSIVSAVLSSRYLIDLTKEISSSTLLLSEVSIRVTVDRWAFRLRKALTFQLSACAINSQSLRRVALLLLVALSQPGIAFLAL